MLFLVGLIEVGPSSWLVNNRSHKHTCLVKVNHSILKNPVIVSDLHSLVITQPQPQEIHPHTYIDTNQFNYCLSNCVNSHHVFAFQVCLLLQPGWSLHFLISLIEDCE